MFVNKISNPVDIARQQFGYTPQKKIKTGGIAETIKLIEEEQEIGYKQ